MAYPNKFKKWNKGGSSNNDGSSSGQTKQRAADIHKNWKFGRLKVTAQQMKPSLIDKEPATMIHIYNLEPEDAKEIVEKLKAEGNSTANSWIDRQEPTHIFFKVYDKNVQNWLDNGDLKKVQFILAKSGKYDANEIAHLEDQIGSNLEVGSDDSNRELTNNSQDSVMQMWKNYLSTIHDKATMDAIMAYNRVYEHLGPMYGHVLTMRNVDLIRSRKSDATFVLSRWEWENQYGRGIKRGATKLPYWTIYKSGKASKEDKQKVKDSTNWKGVDDKDISAQAQKAIEIQANKNFDGNFGITIGYDISDTYLLSGAKTDRWSNEAGLLNNLTGEFNKLALDRESSLGTTTQTQQVAGQDKMEAKTKLVYDYIIANPDMFENVTPRKSGNINKDLTDMIFDICLKRTETKAGILRMDNARIYAENATKVILILTRTATPELSRFNRTYTYDKKEAAVIMKIIYDVVKKIEYGTTLNEGVLSWLKDKAEFAKRVIATLKQIGCKIVASKSDEEAVPETSESINENFYRVFNKINQNLF